jgi:hypothetical protein
MSLTEIFEISNANRRQNKRRKKQQASSVNSSQGCLSFHQICTHQYQYEMSGVKQAQEQSSSLKSKSDVDFLKSMGWINQGYQSE